MYVDVDPTPVARSWQDLVSRNLQRDPHPIFRDPQKYTVDRLRQLAAEANRELGWQWDTNDLSLSNTTLMHKDIEQYLAQGFENIPERYDNLLHDIHFCLHSVESGSRRNSWLQIEWYCDDHEPLPEEQYPAKLYLEFGDVRLQNPYVGHHPMYLWEQDDHHDIMQTCKFHDRITPGICLVVDTIAKNKSFDWNRYLAWWKQHGGRFLDLHGMDKIRNFTGHPVIGKVRNLDDLRECVSRPFLELDRVLID